MVSEVAIPVMDQTTETVTLAGWLKQEGDAVHKGDVICEIETDKATVEVEANADGLLRKVLVKAGVQIPPRTIVALIADADETLPEIDPFYRTPQAKPQQTLPRQETEEPAPVTKLLTVKKGVASPRAKRLAQEHGIDLASIQGTGPEGRILEEDVQQAMEYAGKQKSAATVPGVAQAKVERVSLSWHTIPHFYSTITIDLSRTVAHKTHASNRVTYTDYFALAIARTLGRHSALNGHWRGDRPIASAEIRLGLVVETERGLLITAWRDLRGRALEDIAAEREKLVEQAQAGKLSSEAMAEPTFTLSNVGAGHIDHFTAIISPPQLAILSVGGVQPRPLVIGADLVIRPVATFTLGVDHRAIDGRQAAAFLEQLKVNLESEVS